MAGAEFLEQIQDMVAPRLGPIAEDIALLIEQHGLPEQDAIRRYLGAIAVGLGSQESMETRRPTDQVQNAYLTPGEAAVVLGVSPKTVNRWANEGKVPGNKTLGGHRRFRTEVIEAAAQTMGLYAEESGLDA